MKYSRNWKLKKKILGGLKMAVIRDIDRLKPELVAKRTRDFLAELKKRGIAVIVRSMP